MSKPVTRVTLYPTDETTVHDMLGAAWLTIALRIHVARLLVSEYLPQIFTDLGLSQSQE